MEDAADGENAGRVGLQILVDLDTVLGVAMNPHGLQVKALDVRQAAGGDEKVGARHLARRAAGFVPHGADPAAVLDDDRGDLDVGPEADPLGGQQSLDAAGNLIVLAGQDRGGAREHRDFRPQPPERLREFQGGRLGAEDDQLRG